MRINRVVSILAVFIFVISLLTGCQKKVESGDKATSTKKQEAKGEKKVRDRKADLNGIVTEVAGNEVTIKVIQINEDDEDTDNDKKTKKEDTAKKDEKRKKEDKSFPTYPKKGNGNDGEKKYGVTNETKIITIPVGVPITITTRGEKSEEPKVAEIKDISKGNLLEIWYSEKDKTAISKVIIILAKKNSL